MSAACWRCSCRARNAFEPRRALYDLLGPPILANIGTRASSTVVPKARHIIRKVVLESTSKPPTEPIRDVPVDSGTVIGRKRAQTSTTTGSTKSNVRQKGNRDQIQKQQRWISEPNPNAVDYASGQPWHVLSECTDDECMRRLAAFLLWAGKEPDTVLHGNPTIGTHISRLGIEAATTRGNPPVKDNVTVPPEVLEYTGQVVKPSYMGDPTSEEIPWLRFPNEPVGEAFRMLGSGERLVETLTAQWRTHVLDAHSPVARLNREIEGFVEDILPNELERQARKVVEADVRAVAKRVLPNRELESFGSERTGLATATSDLDFRLLPTASERDADTDKRAAPPKVTRMRLTRSLEMLHKVLQRHQKFMLAHLRHARYPLISLQHKETGIDVQIVSSNDTTYQHALIARYLEEFPALKDVYVIVKTMFDMRGFGDVFRGGIGSYGAFMMTVAALRIQRSRNGVVKGDDPSNLLQHFLQFWGEHDTYKYGVTVEPPGVFEKFPSSDQPAAALQEDTSKNEESGATVRINKDVRGRPGVSRRGVGVINPREPYLLSLIDPADANNDLGRKVSGIKHILATLRHFHQELASDIWNIDAANSGNRDISSVGDWNALVGQHLGNSGSQLLMSDTGTAGKRPKSMLFSAVGPSYFMYKGRRAKMQAVGQARLDSLASNRQDQEQDRQILD